jgi:hypothetical protein
MSTGETTYEIFAFAPDDIASFRSALHQTRADEAKALALRMLESWAACSGCGQEFELMPQDHKRDLITGNLCGRRSCLSEGRSWDQGRGRSCPTQPVPSCSRLLRALRIAFRDMPAGGKRR